MRTDGQPPKPKARSCGRPAKVARESLLDIAERSFSENGFAATTTRHLAAEAGCNVALISYYFGSKDGLYQAVLERYFRELRAEVIQAREATAGKKRELLEAWPELDDVDRARFCATVSSLVSSIFSHSRMHKILFREMMNGGKNAIAALKKTEHGVKDLFEEIFAELKAQGKLRRDLPDALTVLTLIGPAVYSCLASPVLQAVYGHPKTDAAHARTLAVYLTRTLFDGWGSRG